MTLLANVVLPLATADIVLPRPCSAPASRLLTEGAIRLVWQAPPWQSGSVQESGVALRPRGLIIPPAPGNSLSIPPLGDGPGLCAHETSQRLGLPHLLPSSQAEQPWESSHPHATFPWAHLWHSFIFDPVLWLHQPLIYEHPVPAGPSHLNPRLQGSGQKQGT